MISTNLRRVSFACLLIIISVSLSAQTQDDFNKKLSEVYANASDKKKALVFAKELYNMVEKKKDLQIYSNYYLLSTIFETQAPDAALARACSNKARSISNLAVGTTTNKVDTATTPFNQWYYSIYPGLFRISDPDIANKALAFINQYPEFKTFDSYYYIAFALERKGDFNGAKTNYEKALSLDTVPGVYRSYLFYTNFLSKSGDYLKAEENIRKMEQLSVTGNEMFRNSYKAEVMSAKRIHYLSIGDFKSYVDISQKLTDFAAEEWKKNNPNPCNPLIGNTITNLAFGKEMLKEYDEAERLWKTRDSVNYSWVSCHNKTYPNSPYFPISMYPVYLMKRGKASRLPKPASFFIAETETHYNSYTQYSDISVSFMRATQLAFLGSPLYPDIFKPLMQQVKNNRNYRESTTPFANYAYFSMRDKKTEEARKTYEELFRINVDWMNDIIFSFGERAFVTYYNSKLKEGYDNFHSFVKIAKEKIPALYPELSKQAYNNLLFTKSISLKGTQRRKEAFLNANDPAITQLYETWIDKKQQLIRQYMKTDDPSASPTDTANRVNQEQLKKAQEEVNDLENELTAKARDFKKYLKITPPDWISVKDKLKEGEAAIEIIKFQWRDQVYYSDTVYYAAYIITKNSPYPEIVYLPTAAADLDNKYFKAYKKYVTLKTDDKESYDHYWKPIADKLPGIKKIYFSPDGIYHLINISTLRNKENNRFLLDEMEIQYTASSGDVNNASINDIRTAVLMGRPAYKISGESGGTMARDSARSFVNNFKNANISDLPGTEEEVLSIKKEMDKSKITVNTFLKEQATEDKLYKLHSPGILHIATHGYWSPAGESATEGYRVFNAMANSGLLLTGVVNYYSNEIYPDTYDGVLTAYEAQNLDLENTALVILSACETSLGAMDAGEGIYGLQRAFRAAGAGSVITSLWKVDDAATRDFMIAFYQEYLKTKNKLQAFTMAQKTIKEKYKHTYYWGAFVMMGE